MPRANGIHPEIERALGKDLITAEPVKEGSKSIQVTFDTGKQSMIPWALDIEMDEWRLTYTERFIGKEPEDKDLEVQGFINLEHVLELEINEVY